MRVDRHVSVIKFDREIQRLTEQKAALDQRGIFVLGTPSYPVMDVLFVSHNAVIVGSLAAIPSPGEQINVQGVEFPPLVAAPFKVRFELTDYDEQPPSVQFRDPWTDQPYDYNTVVKAHEFEPSRGPHVVLLQDHPETHQPFLCMRGVREYHNHPQHTGDDWMLYRGTLSLFSLIMTVWRVATDIVRPFLMLQPNGAQIQWIVVNKQ